MFEILFLNEKIVRAVLKVDVQQPFLRELPPQNGSYDFLHFWPCESPRTYATSVRSFKKIEEPFSRNSTSNGSMHARQSSATQLGSFLQLTPITLLLLLLVVRNSPIVEE